MEPQKKQVLIHEIYRSTDPQHTLTVSSFLSKCQTDPEDLKAFLNDLNDPAMPISNIGFHNWCNMVRMVTATAKTHKDMAASQLVGQYILKGANYYLPNAWSQTNSQKLDELLKLSKKAIIPKPDLPSTNSKHLVLYMHSKYDEAWGNQLVEIINNDVLVDKKNQSPNSLKINPHMAPFIAQNFASFVPQLERLMVRSQNNIEVLVEFLETCGSNLKGIGEHAVNLLKKYKNLFQTKPEFALKFVKLLTQSMDEEKYFYQAFEFIKGLMATEHNVKKKIIYFRMLEGIIEAQKKYNHSPKIANEIIVVVVISWIKFTQESEAVFVLEILNQLLPLISLPGPEIAENCKQSLKSQNKYILIFVALTLSFCYKDASHIEQFAPVKDCFNVVKSLLPGFIKKKQSTWHYILPFLNFSSTFQFDLVEDLSEIQFIFKKSILALAPIQQQDALNLIVFKYLAYLIKNGEGENVEIDSNICITICILLENNKIRQIWEQTKKQLDLALRIQIIEKGLYPLVYLDPEPIVQKNRANKYQSLSRLLLSSLESLPALPVQVYEKLITVATCCSYSLSKLLPKEIEQDIFDAIAEKYIMLFLLDLKAREENQKNYVTPLMHEIHSKIVNQLCKVGGWGLNTLNELLGKFLDKDYYQKDRSFIAELKSKEVSTKNKHFDEVVNKQKSVLTEMQYYTQVKPPKRKIHLGSFLDSKMMSEAEVKEQQYREHFDEMLTNFNRIVNEILLLNVNSCIGRENKNIWDHNFDNFINIVSYPEHRMSVYKIVKASFQNFSVEKIQGEEKVIAQLKKMFLRYSNFFADFYAIRGAHLTPPVYLMNKAQRFYSELLGLNYSILQKDHYSIKFINDLSLYILENMEFDLSVKEQALNFFNSCITKQKEIQHIDTLYTYLVKNMNIISSSESIENVLLFSMNKVDPKRYGELFVEILNYVNKTKKLVLRTILKAVESETGNSYEPSFEDYIKLRILVLDDSADDEISKSADKLLLTKSKNTSAISTTIAHFDMRSFITNNTKDTIEKLCKFMKESITPDNINDMFELVLRTADQLYDENFDQEGLQFLPYFLSLNLEMIPEKFLHKIFQILIMKYTSNEQLATLSRMSVDVGIDIIKHHAHKSGEKMLLTIESFLTKAKGISNIVFLGVLAPYLKGNKNLNVIEKRITELFKGENRAEQCSIAKCMPDLMSFFKNPDQIVQNIFEQISKLDEKTQTGQSYLVSGLLKGLGPKKMLVYLEKLISEDYPSKTKGDKIGRCQFFRAFVENFGRVIELKGLRIIDVLLHYMSDSNEEVRNFSKSVVQIFVTKMSSFSIRELLPHLLTNLENEQNWRVKISYIWILGIMANCSAKQLQTSLPIIVPTLSGCLSNAHPTIREKASEALSLIGQTIQNPEISASIDILIEALENPFEKSAKAIEILLKTRFSHYIDPPSLSIIVPIIDYCLRGRVSELKEGACQVIGSITELILNPSDMLPYLKFVGSGIKTALCDPLPEIRSIAAMAIGKISSKIGAAAAKQYFSFIYDLIDSPTSNTTEKTGAAQAYAELICSQGYEYFEESLTGIFNRLAEPPKSIPKEGYILIFLYVPGIRRDEFQGFIKEVNENTYCYVSDEDEALRNSSMQVSKVLINNYGVSHTDLLLGPLSDGIFESNWRKRNAALILLGELLNVLKLHIFHNKDYSKNDYYYQALMAVYIEKDDDLEMPRQTANYVWNTYIENTPKTIKSGLQTLVKMWTKFTHAADGVVERNITSFTVKYGENFFTEILSYLEFYSEYPEHKEGTFLVLTELFKRMTHQFLSKPAFKTSIRSFFDMHIFKVDGTIRKALTDSLSLYVEKMHEEEYFENLVYPKIDKMAQLNEENPEYTDMLHLIRDLLHNSASAKVIERLISKVTENPLSEFKIEVITNNTDKIANNLYSSFKVPATQGMLDEIISLVNNPSKSNRLALLVYCMDQVSIKLQNKYKNLYINMLIKYLRSYRNKKEDLSLQVYEAVIGKMLEMLVFFLHSIDLNDIDSLDELIGEISPHIFKGTDSIKANAHKIFLLLISDHKATKTGTYYKQMIVSLDNQRSESDNKGFVIWGEQGILRDYINTIVKGLVYGNNDNIEENIEMTKFLIKNADPKIIDPQITRILGPIIRVCSYPLFQKQKERLLEFIKQLYNKGYKGALEVYNYQVVSLCIRILNESKIGSKKNSYIGEEVAKTLFFVITKQTNNRNRELLLNFIMERAKGEVLAELIYSLLNDIMRENQEILPLTAYKKIQSAFKTMTQDPESKHTIKTVYFMSKTIQLIEVVALNEGSPGKAVMTFEDLLLELQRAYYRKQAIPKTEKIELLLKQSPREKVYYILKCIHECCLANQRNMDVYTGEYIRAMVPESLSGFDDIVEILEYFD